MRLFKLWSPVVLWAGLIFLLSGIPNLKTELECDFFLRKAAHIGEYFILTFFLYRAFKGTFVLPVQGLFFVSSMLALLYAVSDEIHQSFVPGRSCSLNDVMIDGVGIVCFLIFAGILGNKFRGRPVKTDL